MGRKEEKWGKREIKRERERERERISSAHIMADQSRHFTGAVRSSDMRPFVSAEG